MAQSIRDLLEKDKWEVRTLEDIAESVASGNEVTKSQLGTGDYPAIRYSEIHKSSGFIHECQSFVNPDAIKNGKYCECGDLLMVKTSEDVFNSGKHAVFLCSNKAIVGSDIVIIKHQQNPKFLSYILSTNFCREQTQKNSHGGIVVHIGWSKLKTVKIPLPPRHVQDLIGDFWYELTQSVSRLSEKLKRENGDLGSTEMRYLRAGS